MIKYKYQDYEIEHFPTEYQEVFDIVKEHNLLVAGSFAAWMCHPDPFVEWRPSDIDIYGVNGWTHRSNIINDIEDCSGYTYESYGDALVARATPVSSSSGLLPIELVNWHGAAGLITSEEQIKEDSIMRILDLFDFAQSSVAVYYTGNDERRGTWVGIGDVNAYDKRLFIRDKILNPLAAMQRITKYETRGYEVTGNNYRELFRQWDDLPPVVKKEAYKGNEIRWSYPSDDILSTRHPYGNLRIIYNHWIKLQEDDSDE